MLDKTSPDLVTLPAAEPSATPAPSAFRDLALERRLATVGRDSLRLKEEGATSYDEKPWSLLYRALVDSIGASPENFQLIYPFTPWTWATQDVGFISAAQYDFCSVVPQWSAVGAYVSSADRFHQAYEQLLNIVVAQTEDPVLREKIRVSAETLTAATNDYTTAYTAAEAVYADSPAGQANNPPFTNWLGTPAGKGWQTKIAAAETRMNQAQKNFNALVAQANTPGLENAHLQFANTEFYARLKDPNLASFPKVPSWGVSQNAAAWVDRIKAGNGPAGAVMGFTNRDASYDFQKTWAGGSASVSRLFWQVEVAGKWERVTEFESDQELEVSLEFEAIDLVQITPSGWYNGPFVKSVADGPFVHGYSPDGGGGSKAVFGEKGFIGLLKTGMYVGYKPTFTIRTSQSTFDSFVEKFKASTGIRIGPFTMKAEGGSEKSQWSSSSSGRSFTGTTTSGDPMILGVTVARLPRQASGEEVLLAERAEEPRGHAYRFEDGAGDLLASGVTEAEAKALGAGSFVPFAPRLGLTTRHGHDVRVLPMYGDPLITDSLVSADFDGPNLVVMRVGPFPVTKPIPKVGQQYRITGTWDATNQPFAYTVTCTVAGRPGSQFRP